MRTKISGLIIIFMISFFAFSYQSISAPVWETKNFRGVLGDINVFLNGETVETRVEPFIIEEEGVTMVSLRDLSEALGFDVHWDSENRDIYISGASVMPEENWKRNEKKKIEEISVIRNIGPFYQKKSGPFMIAGRPFNSGVAVHLDNNPDNNTAEMVLDLNQQYSTLEGNFGVDDETMNSRGGYRLTILGDNKELFTSEIVKPSEYPRNLSPGAINLTYVNRLTIRVTWVEAGLGAYDEIIPALANFNFYLKEGSIVLAASTPGASYSEVAIVKAGDTLFSLAQKHDTTVPMLLYLNPEIDRESMTIKIGQAIRLP